MGLFTFKYSEYDSELEIALQSIPFCGDITFNYNGQGKEKDKITVPPVCLLPVDSHGDRIYGYFTIDGKLKEAPLGFLRRKHFLFKEHFRLNLDGAVVLEQFQENTLYLPLTLTDLFMNLGTVNNGKFTLSEGAPFPIFGVEGSRGKYPLILVSENEDGIKCKGLYKTKEGKLSTYDHQAMRAPDEPIRNFLRTLRGVPTSTPTSLEESISLNILGVKKTLN